jgi:hypothetical protein
MSLLTTEADGAAASSAQLAPVRAAKRQQGVPVARELALSMLVGLLVAGVLLVLLTVEPRAAKVELPSSNPRPKLLDQPYRPHAPAAR